MGRAEGHSASVDGPTPSEMSTPGAMSDARDWRARLDDFALSAERFVRWAEDPQRPWTLDDAERLLLELLRHGLELVDAPDEVDEDDERPEPDDVTDAEWKTVFKRGAELPFDSYWAALQPHEFDEEQRLRVDSLSDDLADTYRDVLRGLRAYRAARLGDASHEWRFGHQSHWGQHAANAVAAIREFRFGGR
jgi:hypothetical protein